MKRLPGLLLVMGIVGCGQNENAGNAVDPSVGADDQLVTDSGGGKESSSHAEPATSTASADTDPVAALEKLGSEISRNGDGEVDKVNLQSPGIASDEILDTSDSTSSAKIADKNTTSLSAQDADDRHFSKNLTLQMTDDFRAKLDAYRWRIIQGNTRTENGSCLMQAFRSPPPGPGGFTFSMFGLKEKCLTPSLKGDNGVEITLEGYTHETNYPKGLDENIPRGHIMGWGLTLANWRGQIGSQKDPRHDRGLQLHIDWMGPQGVYISFVRGLVPEDFKAYSNDNVWRSTPEAFRTQQDKLIEKGAFISEPCLVMACRIYRPDKRFLEKRHRYGLYLTDDARTAYWKLDGKVMDSFDITGYFDSSPKCAKEGLYLTIAAAGIYQKNVWKVDDLGIYTSAKSAGRRESKALGDNGIPHPDRPNPQIR